MSPVWCWDDSCSADVSHKIDLCSKKVFQKEAHQEDKPLYTTEIRSLLDKGQGVKKHIRKCGSSQCRIKSKLGKLDTLMNKRVTAFNSSIVAKGVGKDGTISKQDFWKIKKS